jgi:CheY-like chemotaxis protein
MENSKKSSQSTTKVILVAEDDDINFFFITMALDKEPFTIIRARNGQEAVEIFEKNPEIGLIIMDIKMPVMNGFEATRIIKATNPNTIIVAITAYALVGDREKTMEAGCDDYLSKPIQKSELIKMINKYM